MASMWSKIDFHPWLRLVRRSLIPANHAKNFLASTSNSSGFVMFFVSMGFKTDGSKELSEGLLSKFIRTSISEILRPSASPTQRSLISAVARFCEDGLSGFESVLPSLLLLACPCACENSASHSARLSSTFSNSRRKDKINYYFVSVIARILNAPRASNTHVSAQRRTSYTQLPKC